MHPTPTVLGVLRRFLPAFLEGHPPLSPQQRRALWAITHCRTATLGGNVFECEPCGKTHFAWHSCNHPRRYVARTAIGDSRIVDADADSVTFRWVDRAHGNQTKLLTLPGGEFVGRYLRHVLPRGLRSIRYYGFCHPAAKAKRLRLQLLTQSKVDFGAMPSAPATITAPRCPDCGRPMSCAGSIRALYPARGPPRPVRSLLSTVSMP